MRIINDSDSTLSIEAQEILRQRAANIGGVEIIDLTRTADYDTGEIFAVQFLGEADEYGQREILHQEDFDTDGSVFSN